MMLWLFAADGFLELLQCGQLNDICRKLIPVFHGARKEAVFVRIGGCTKSGETNLDSTLDLSSRFEI